MSTDYALTFQVNLDAHIDLPLGRMREAIAHVLSVHNVIAGTGLSIVIVDDATMQQMNQQYRDIDQPTDVLSFPADPSPVPDGETDELYLGDLVLALPYIQRQATVEEHTLSDELTLVVIHGTLHLLGYDHDTAANQTKMWTVQADMLKAMGVVFDVPTFEFPDESEEK